ncbi:hypothetical protein [Labrenzia sp. VG12]|uniref:hypothetical protein n=1 Tax=Labrenzia sp. VG12 TaxID=2021862 RepID=UPI0012FE396A|nr:hypothetical protein [Labrenzia sp. VG12]
MVNSPRAGLHDAMQSIAQLAVGFVPNGRIVRLLVSIVLAGIVGVGIVLTHHGWRRKNYLLLGLGGVFVFFGLALFALDTIAEMKKAGII